MGTISLVIPQIGQPDTTEDVKVQNAFTTIQTVINGNLDSGNLSATTSQSAGVNASGQTVKGAVNIATSQNTSSTTFTTLATPDQVTGVVLPANGLITVWYQATWQASVAGAAAAAIFLGSNQLQITASNGTTLQVTQAGINGSNTNTYPLSTNSGGLGSFGSVGGYVGDATTGQVIASSSSSGQQGPCSIFAAAGTYTVSVQFKASSGTVTASNRKLWVSAQSFA